MKTTEKKKLTINALFLILLALLFLSGTLMWLQHSEYHNQNKMGWMKQDRSQHTTESDYNN